MAQGVPFAREYGGLLANRSFGGAQVSRTFYARGQTGQQLLLGAYQALEKEIAKGGVTMYPRTEMLDLVVVDGRARGIVVARPGHRRRSSRISPTRWCSATGGYGNVFYLSTNAKGSNATAIWRAYKRGAAFANPCFTQIHPTCIPVSGELSVEAHADERVAAQRRPRLGAEAQGGLRQAAATDSRSGARLLPRAEVSELRQPRRRATSRRAPRRKCATKAAASGPAGAACISTSRDAIKRLGEDKIRERYGNLFEMYERITDENPYEVPMRIYPAVHYTMGGLWVDYNLMSTIPGLYVLGEANFSDHGANRLGASALMQGLADGYFILPLHDRRLPRRRTSWSR